MLNHKYTTINRVLENVIRDTGFSEEIDFVEALEWAYRAMELIGAPQIYIEKVTDGNKELGHSNPITIVDYKGEIPCDVHQIIQVREYYNRLSLREANTQFIYSTNVNNIVNNSDLSYRINDGYIFTNFKEGVLEIAYYGFPLDESGYPAIPDDERYLKAVESYIAERIARRLWLQDKLATDKYRALEQDWLFYVKSAKSRAQMPTLDGMESLKNQIVRLIDKPYNHANQFETLGERERLRITNFNKIL